MKMRHVVFALVALLTASLGYADTKISALPGASTPLGGSEVVPIVQSGATVKATITDIRGPAGSSVFKASDTSRASTTTRTADPALAFAALAAGTYKIDGVLYFQSASSTPDVTFAIVAGTAPTSGRVAWTSSESGGIILANSNNSQVTVSPGDAGNFPVTGGSVASAIILVNGWVTLPSTTTLAVFWAQAGSDPTAMILKQGSWFAVQAM